MGVVQRIAKSGVAPLLPRQLILRPIPRPTVRLSLPYGDEEGDAIDGTTAILDWMNEHGQSMDHCLVGEPTSPNHK